MEELDDFSSETYVVLAMMDIDADLFLKIDEWAVKFDKKLFIAKNVEELFKFYFPYAVIIDAEFFCQYVRLEYREIYESIYGEFRDASAKYIFINDGNKINVRKIADRLCADADAVYKILERNDANLVNEAIAALKSMKRTIYIRVYND